MSPTWQWSRVIPRLVGTSDITRVNGRVVEKAGWMADVRVECFYGGGEGRETRILRREKACFEATPGCAEIVVVKQDIRRKAHEILLHVAIPPDNTVESAFQKL